jgi:transposase, IS30 family
MPKGYHHVTRDQRCQIYTLKAMQLSLREIATQLNVHVSTVSRELRRNKGDRGYRIARPTTKHRHDEVGPARGLKSSQTH